MVEGGEEGPTTEVMITVMVEGGEEWPTTEVMITVMSETTSIKCTLNSDHGSRDVHTCTLWLPQKASHLRHTWKATETQYNVSYSVFAFFTFGTVHRPKRYLSRMNRRSRPIWTQLQKGTSLDPAPENKNKNMTLNRFLSYLSHLQPVPPPNFYCLQYINSTNLIPRSPVHPSIYCKQRPGNEDDYKHWGMVEAFTGENVGKLVELSLLWIAHWSHQISQRNSPKLWNSWKFSPSKVSHLWKVASLSDIVITS